MEDNSQTGDLNKKNLKPVKEHLTSPEAFE